MPKYKVVFPLSFASTEYKVGDVVEFDTKTGDFLTGPIGPGGVAYLEKMEEEHPKKKQQLQKRKDDEK